MALYSRIRQLRRKHSLTQLQVANAIGVARPAVTQWEAGTTRPRLEFLVPLAELFDVTVDDLLAEDEEADRDQQESQKTQNGWTAVVPTDPV